MVSGWAINKPAPFSWSDFFIKKTAHVIEYVILYWLVWRAASNKGKITHQSLFLKVLLVTVLYALSDEWHQTLIPGRTGTLRDVGFDTIGMLLSLTQIKKNL